MCNILKSPDRYEFGSVFETRECEECECLLDGEVRCAEKECPPCEDEVSKPLDNAAAAILRYKI